MLNEGDAALSRVAAFLRAHVDAAVTGGAERRG
jgi:hypothetical protein